MKKLPRGESGIAASRLACEVQKLVTPAGRKHKGALLKFRCNTVIFDFKALYRSTRERWPRFSMGAWELS